MSTEKDKDPMTKLAKLASKLEKVYPAAGDRVSKAVKPVSELLEKIGVTWREPHYAERLNETGSSSAGLRPKTRITEDVGANGPYEEYILSAARSVTGPVRLRVSKCSYFITRTNDEEGVSWETAKIEEIKTVDIGELPLSVRVQILEARNGDWDNLSPLDNFVELYESYVSQKRGNLLNGSVVPPPEQ